MMKLIAILFGIVLLFPIGIAYGDKDVSGQYFCNPNNMLSEKIGYAEKIFIYNSELESFKLQNPNVSMEELNDYMKFSSHIKEMGENAKCLKENGVNPESVAKLSDEVKEVLMYDLESFADISPNFVNYVEVPEFHEIAMMVLASGIIGIVAITRNIRLMK